MSLNIVFMGTPEFAKVNLQELINKNYNVKAVFTQPDKPQGRKKILTFSPVKELALQHNISVYQPDTLKNEKIYNILKEINPDVIVIVAYGKILPSEILKIPKYGCVNVHGSLLPKYRGASPIQTAIINGEIETGITTIYIDEGLDSGNIILSKKIDIDIDDDAITMYSKLAILGSKVLVNTLDLIENNQAPSIKQEGEASYCKIFKKEDGLINWNKSAMDINNLVRGIITWPIAYTIWNNKTYKIFKTAVLKNEESCKFKPGEFVTCNSKDGLKIMTGDGIIEVIELQVEGKKRMNCREYLKGNNI